MQSVPGRLDFATLPYYVFTGRYLSSILDVGVSYRGNNDASLTWLLRGLVNMTIKGICK